MLNGIQGESDAGFDVQVFTTNNRGHSPEELAERAIEKLISISETADPMVKAQAMVFKDHIRELIIFYMKEAIRSDRTTICAELAKQGHADLARIISKI